jgi:hypothetical protein
MSNVRGNRQVFGDECLMRDIVPFPNMAYNETRKPIPPRRAAGAVHYVSGAMSRVNLLSGVGDAL